MNELAIPSRPKQYGPESCIPDQTRCWRAHVFPLLLILTLIWIIYANSFSGTWVFDDEPNIVANPNVHMKSLDWESFKKAFSGTNISRIDRPLSYMTFAINHLFGELDPWGYHLVNIIIHSVAAVFLYLLIYNTLLLPSLKEKYANSAGSIALLATSLWASHPIHATSITYIVQRMTSMCAMFYLISLYSFLKFRMASSIYSKTAALFLCIFSGFLALLSKENAATLPVIIFILDILLVKKFDTKISFKNLLYIITILAILILILLNFSNPSTILSGYNIRNFTLCERLLTQPRVFLFYLSLLLYPITGRFTLIYDFETSTSIFFPLTTIPSIIFWIIWIVLSIFISNKRPLISFCLIFFFLNHLIEGSFIPLEMIYEHRNYLPSISIFLLLSVFLIEKVLNQRNNFFLKISGISFVLITLFGHGQSVIDRNILFNHPLFIWQDNFNKNPNSSRINNNLGLAYLDLELFEKSEESFRNALKFNRYHRKDTIETIFYNLGNLYLKKNDFHKALIYYNEALSINPKMFPALFNKANLQTILGQNDKAIETLQILSTNEPLSPKIKSLEALLQLKLNKYEESIRLAYASFAIKDDQPVLWKVLGEAYTKIGDYERGKIFWHKYLDHKPDDIESILALINLAKISNDKFLLKKYCFQLSCTLRSYDLKKIEAAIKRLSSTQIKTISISNEDLFYIVASGLHLVMSEDLPFSDTGVSSYK